MTQDFDALQHRARALPRRDPLIWHGRGAFDAGPHPSIEEIAALIDGRLKDAERDRIAGHLADCAECYEVFTDTVRFQQEEAEADAPVVVPFSRRKKRMSSPFGDRQRLGRVARQAAAVAAVLLVAVGGAWIYQRSQTPEMIVADLVAPLKGKIGSDDLHQWRRYRGEKIDASSKAAFRLGGLLVDLRASMRTGDRGSSEDLLRSIVLLMGAASFGNDEERAAAFTALADQAKNGADPRTLVDEVEALEGPFGEGGVYLTDEFDPSFLAFGKWAEAGRLSAVARSPAFFEDRDTWRFLDRLQKEEPDRLKSVAEQLDLIESPRPEGRTSAPRSTRASRRRSIRSSSATTSEPPRSARPPTARHQNAGLPSGQPLHVPGLGGH